MKNVKDCLELGETIHAKEIIAGALKGTERPGMEDLLQWMKTDFIMRHVQADFTLQSRADLQNIH